MDKIIWSSTSRRFAWQFWKYLRQEEQIFWSNEFWVMNKFLRTIITYIHKFDFLLCKLHLITLNRKDAATTFSSVLKLGQLVYFFAWHNAWTSIRFAWFKRTEAWCQAQATLMSSSGYINLKSENYVKQKTRWVDPFLKPN